MIYKCILEKFSEFRTERKTVGELESPAQFSLILAPGHLHSPYLSWCLLSFRSLEPETGTIKPVFSLWERESLSSWDRPSGILAYCLLWEKLKVPEIVQYWLFIYLFLSLRINFEWYTRVELLWFRDFTKGSTGSWIQTAQVTSLNLRVLFWKMGRIIVHMPKD